MKAFSILGLLCLPLLALAQTDTLTLFDFEDQSSAQTFTVFGNYYLDGETMETISNPMYTSVNISDKVMKYTRSTNADWKAGFSIDVSNSFIPNTAYEVCFDYMSYHEGTCYLELEGTTSLNYTQETVPYVNAGAWQTICYKVNRATLTSNALVVDKSPLNINSLVFYPDYKQWGDGVEHEYFIDNISFCYTTGERLVTFQVNMDNYEKSFDALYVSGNFNGWSGNQNPLDDDDGDGIWSADILLKDDYIEYVFTMDGWSDFEKFEEDYTCISSTADGEGGFYRNRFAQLDVQQDLPMVCYQSCEDCPETNTITWNLNMTEQVVSDEGVYLAGGEFGHGEYEMLDDDGDGIYSISLKRPLGFQSHYTFINGLCPAGWWCKEDLSGQACADADSYNDRYLTPVYSNRIVDACFGYCSSNGFCEEEILYEVSFNLDVRDAYFDGVVGLAGTMNGWSYSSDLMHDDDGDGIYSVTVLLSEGLHEYKYVVDKKWEDLDPEQDCTITDLTGLYTNRYVEVIDNDLFLTEVEFELCAGYSDTVQEVKEDIQVYPTLASDYIYLNLEDHHEDVLLRVIDVSGASVIATSLSGGAKESVAVYNLPAGMYYVTMQSGQTQYTSSFVKL